MEKRMLRMVLFMLTLCFVTGCASEAGYPLKMNAGGKARTVAEVIPPKGYKRGPQSAMADCTEYYFVPEAADDPVRFLYYTAGEGEPRALAEAALASYGVFYDEFEAGEICEDDLGGRRCLRFDYTCAYPDDSGERMVYEQTAVAYVPIEDGRFIACIASLGFGGAGDYRSAGDLAALLGEALEAVRIK